ncbi:hypothetical protein OC25_09320 [Pedobacter kyungheensis]|uniref:Uncharacterized protein n=1 Tax=Pedobacter kyungheensis TaxID=1069985 RepID=A0A0C1G386_9SPHI|nr:hypothetical protein OC25_09320 [Pedobacter kyungheensis]
MENLRFCGDGIFSPAITASPRSYLAAGFTFYHPPATGRGLGGQVGAGLTDDQQPFLQNENANFTIGYPGGVPTERTCRSFLGNDY